MIKFFLKHFEYFESVIEILIEFNFEKKNLGKWMYLL